MWHKPSNFIDCHFPSIGGVSTNMASSSALRTSVKVDDFIVIFAETEYVFQRDSESERALSGRRCDKNDLPADIVSAPSLAIFKRRLKTYLFG